jgi:hypothetical protein
MNYTLFIYFWFLINIKKKQHGIIRLQNPNAGKTTLYE